MRFHLAMKVGGAVACISLVLLNVISLPGYIAWLSADRQYGFGVIAGGAMILRGGQRPIDFSGPWLDPGWNRENIYLVLWPWQSPFAKWPLVHYADADVKSYTLPLWMPILAIGIPTTVLWIRGRRRFAAGRCQGCGYDLTGNTTGTCPECGANVANAPKTKACESR